MKLLPLGKLKYFLFDKCSVIISCIGYNAAVRDMSLKRELFINLTAQ